MDRRRKINVQEAVALFEAGFNCIKIAEHLGVTKQGMYYALEKAGVYFKREQQRKILPYVRPISDNALRAQVRLHFAIEDIKEKARIKLRYAITRGKIKPQPCEVCGKLPILKNGQRGIHGHHDDYSKPLKVRWLCGKHHAEWHKHNTPKCTVSHKVRRKSKQESTPR